MNQPEEKNPTILLVDDTPVNIQVLANCLKEWYQIKIATNGAKALAIATSTPHPDLILLDVMMPEMDGYEVCQNLKQNPATAQIPVLFITAMAEKRQEARGLAVGAVDYITKPFVPELVLARVKIHLELKFYRENLERMVQERTRELELTQDVTIQCMGTLAESRDQETGGHIKRTQKYIGVLAKALQNHPRFRDYLNDLTVRQLYKSAPLHDIGKVGIPDHILLKPGKLTDEEFALMKEHAQKGSAAIASSVRWLGSNSFLACAQEIAATHHEKWDGSGYPQGLRGAEIPISGRLMALADVYDALISKRVYKESFTHEKAVATISEGRGSHFDPDVVDAFLSLQEVFCKIALQFADCDEERENLQPAPVAEPGIAEATNG